MCHWQRSNPLALEEIYNFYRLSDRLATSGQPTQEQFADIADAGFEAVINLALPTSRDAVAAEPTLVANYGMEYIPIPVIWEAPTREDLLRFFDVMDANANRRLYVHCQANMRVSAFVFLYRVLKLGVPEREAEKDLHQLWKPQGWWDTFVEDNLERGLD